MKTTRQLLHFILFSFLFFPLTGSTHPHSWVELKTEIDGNKNEIVGFDMQWTFDAMSSAYMIDGYDLSPEKKAQSFQEIADAVLNNMLTEHYFTFFYDGEEPIRYKRAINAKLTQQGAKVTLAFYLPLSKPQPALGTSLRLLIYEPSYYVDISWKQKSDISLSAELKNACTVELKEPKPTPERKNYALALPADADPDNALGQLFTQTVTLNCL
ncbi:DUF1007 family protein [Psychromonas sp.]|uniref:DUF1007 family protein n=1 Tax=Psychromonas sp. TaxID=1884585 RepID=UPI003564EFC0